MLYLIFIAWAAIAPCNACPCDSPELCLPVSVTHEIEVFGFIDPSVRDFHYRDYDWTQITTIAWADDVDMVCEAHRHGTRVVMNAHLDKDVLEELHDEEWRKVWISKAVKKGKDHYLDGINFDLEVPLLPSDPLTLLYALLVQEAASAFHTQIPGSQISVDIPWSPFDIDGRNYDWQTLADAADLCFVMVYDTQSQIYGQCVASANSPSAIVHRSLHQWTEVLGLPRNKLVLGLPWYGYKYPCLNTNREGSDICILSAVPFRGAPCSDAAGSQVTYGSIMSILRDQNATAKWDSLTESPYFDYEEDGGQRYQVWYDDPMSLAIKYQIANEYKLRGVGVWHIEALDYWDPSWDEMWEALKVFTRPYESGSVALWLDSQMRQRV